MILEKQQSMSEIAGLSLLWWCHRSLRAHGMGDGTVVCLYVFRVFLRTPKIQIFAKDPTVYVRTFIVSWIAVATTLLRSYISTRRLHARPLEGKYGNSLYFTEFSRYLIIVSEHSTTTTDL